MAFVANHHEVGIGLVNVELLVLGERRRIYQNQRILGPGRKGRSNVTFFFIIIVANII